MYSIDTSAAAAWAGLQGPRPRARRGVAIKVLNPSSAGPVPPTERFKRGARIARRINHPMSPGLRSFLGAGVSRSPRSTFPGATSTRSCRRPAAARAGAPLPALPLLGTRRRATLGVVHRDLSRPTSSSTPRTYPRARLRPRLPRRRPQPVALARAGVRAPCSHVPEQAFGRETVDHRADLYSLGCPRLPPLAMRAAPFAAGEAQEVRSSAPRPRPSAAELGALGLPAVSTTCSALPGEGPRGAPPSARAIHESLEATFGGESAAAAGDHTRVNRGPRGHKVLLVDDDRFARRWSGTCSNHGCEWPRPRRLPGVELALAERPRLHSCSTC